jgi:hypothetical protein
MISGPNRDGKVNIQHRPRKDVRRHHLPKDVALRGPQAQEGRRTSPPTQGRGATWPTGPTPPLIILAKELLLGSFELTTKC